MKIVFEIELGNDLTWTPRDVLRAITESLLRTYQAAIVDSLADNRIVKSGDSGSILDENSNKVGTWLAAGGPPPIKRRAR